MTDFLVSLLVGGYPHVVRNVCINGTTEGLLRHDTDRLGSHGQEVSAFPLPLRLHEPLSRSGVRRPSGETFPQEDF